MIPKPANQVHTIRVPAVKGYFGIKNAPCLQTNVKTKIQACPIAGVLGPSLRPRAIQDAPPHFGASLDALGNRNRPDSMPGRQRLIADNYECTWALYPPIPSLPRSGKPCIKNPTRWFIARAKPQVQSDEVVRPPDFAMSIPRLARCVARRTSPDSSLSN